MRVMLSPPLARSLISIHHRSTQGWGTWGCRSVFIKRVTLVARQHRSWSELNLTCPLYLSFSELPENSFRLSVLVRANTSGAMYLAQHWDELTTFHKITNFHHGVRHSVRVSLYMHAVELQYSVGPPCVHLTIGLECLESCSHCSLWYVRDFDVCS